FGLDGGDVGDLLHVEQGGGARHHILAEGGGGGDHVAVVGGELGHQRRQVLGKAVRVGRVVGLQYLRHTGYLRGCLSNGLAAEAGDQDMNITRQLAGSGDGVQRGWLQRRVVVLGDDQRRHQITFASLRSLSTSSATEATFTPALRAGGSFTWTMVRRGLK